MIDQSLVFNSEDRAVEIEYLNPCSAKFTLSLVQHQGVHSLLFFIVTHLPRPVHDRVCVSSLKTSAQVMFYRY